jgi:hypothetical protein
MSKKKLNSQEITELTSYQCCLNCANCFVLPEEKDSSRNNGICHFYSEAVHLRSGCTNFKKSEYPNPNLSFKHLADIRDIAKHTNLI